MNPDGGVAVVARRACPEPFRLSELRATRFVPLAPIFRF